MPNPLLYGIMALGGYALYEGTKPALNAAGQPPDNQKPPFWQNWLNGGSQPATGNGTPTTDTTAVSNAVDSVAKFGTSIAHYFGTADTGGAAAGSGVGANSSQIDSYGAGESAADAGTSGIDYSQWGM